MRSRSPSRCSTAKSERRLRAAWPHAIALAVYLAWRFAILGKLVGGYAWTFSAAEAPRLVARTAASIVRTLAGPQIAVGTALALLVVIGIALALRSRFAVAAVVVGFGAAVAPILPVAIHYENRFAWGVWLCAVVVFAAGADSLRNRRLALALLIATPLLGLVVNRQQWQIEYSRAKRMSDEAIVYSYLKAGEWLRMPAIPPGEMYQLASFCQHMLGRPEGALWFDDDLYLCSGRRLQRAFGWDERTREVRELTAELPAIAARYCATIRPSEPLQLRFHVDSARRLLTWELGPYDDGYSVVTGDGWNAYPVQRRDGLQLFGANALALRVRYRSPQGWVTYSPELSIDLTRDNDVVWHR